MRSLHFRFRSIVRLSISVFAGIGQGCGTALPQLGSLEDRNLAALERFQDQRNENDCDPFFVFGFPSRSDVTAALCDLTPFFECQTRSTCDSFFFFEQDEACEIPEGCIPDERISIFDEGRMCLDENELAELPIGTEELSFPSTVYEARRSAAGDCFECSPDTATNSCFSSQLDDDWSRVIVNRVAGFITVDAVDRNNIVSMTATGRIDSDGSFVAVLGEAETNDFDVLMLRISGNFSEIGFAAKFSFRASNANFKPSDFQWDLWVAYRTPGTGCNGVDSFNTCIELGLPFDLIDELFSAASVFPEAGFTDESMFDLLNPICRLRCEGFECDSCAVCADAIVADPCR